MNNNTASRQEPTRSLDIVAPLKALQARAEANLTENTDFRDGYLFALAHAIELLTLTQIRVDLAAGVDSATKLLRGLKQTCTSPLSFS